MNDEFICAASTLTGSLRKRPGLSLTGLYFFSNVLLLIGHRSPFIPVMIQSPELASSVPSKVSTIVFDSTRVAEISTGR